MTEQLHQSIAFFTKGLIELTLLFIGISFVVGCINQTLPQDKVQKLLAGRNGRGYVIGALLGGITPFCSCSTIPMMVGLLKAGAGFGPTMSFLFASPLVNPILLGLFIGLLGVKITLVYALLSLSLAVFSGISLEQLGFERFLKEQRKTAPGCCKTSRTIGPIQTIQPLQYSETPVQTAETVISNSGECCQVREFPFPYPFKNLGWHRIFNESIKQFISFFPYIVFGIAVGAFIHGFIPESLISRVAGEENNAVIPLAALAGIPLYIRAAALVPMAASLIAKGMSIGAVIALIIGGAGASLPEVIMLKGLFKLPLLLAFLFSVFFTAITMGFTMNMVI